MLELYYFIDLLSWRNKIGYIYDLLILLFSADDPVQSIDDLEWIQW